LRLQHVFPRAINGVLGYAAFLICVVVSTSAQNLQGFPEDWSHHHLVFSNPGTFRDALRNGTYDGWASIVTDPRYGLQQLKRTAGAPPVVGEPNTASGGIGVGHGRPLVTDWTVQLSGTVDSGVALSMYPAKYSYDQTIAPNCANDFVVFPINLSGNGSNQANLLGVNNMYNTTCTGGVPTVLFAYFVGTGKIQTSPVLSLDGAKAAFVESIASGSIFHVLTLDKSGNSGCPSAKPCNGTAFNVPKAPGGALNNAVDTKITMSGGVSVTRSSPFVDYANDIAYVGDDTGKLHKFTGVFLGTLAEAGSPWPVTVSSGNILTGPVFDGGASKNIFVGASNGNLYCLTSAGAACATASITVGSGTNPAILDAPIVDSTRQTVFAAARTNSNVVLAQATTALASPVIAAMGKSPTGTQNIYNGAFDSAYFANVSTGHMYFCGNDANGFNTLLRVGFNASGTMAGAPDLGSFALTTGATVDCTPLTAILNTAQGKDYLFVGIRDFGFTTGTTNCSGHTCIASFVLPTASPFTFPSAANAATPNGLGNSGTSGMIIDNISGLAGTSQIYFGNLQNFVATQLSQSALQ